MKRKPKPKGVRMWAVYNRKYGYWGGSTSRYEAEQHDIYCGHKLISGTFIPDAPKPKSRKR